MEIEKNVFKKENQRHRHLYRRIIIVNLSTFMFVVIVLIIIIIVVVHIVVSITILRQKINVNLLTFYTITYIFPNWITSSKWIQINVTLLFSSQALISTDKILVLKLGKNLYIKLSHHNSLQRLYRRSIYQNFIDGLITHKIQYSAYTSCTIQQRKIKCLSKCSIFTDMQCESITCIVGCSVHVD